MSVKKIKNKLLIRWCKCVTVMKSCMFLLIIPYVYAKYQDQKRINNYFIYKIYIYF